MEIWVSDRGYCEGGTRLKSVEKELAYYADLDGDDINDEYLYMDDEEVDINLYQEKGYELCANKEVLSKEILIIEGQ